MIRKLLATTAFATVLASGAFAQEATTPAPAPAAPAESVAPIAPADGHLASNIIGENVYNGTAENAEKIGDVNDIVLNDDGQVESVVVGVGGFLGIGEKNVAIGFKDLSWNDRNGDRWLVTEASKESLEAQPAFDRTGYDVAPAQTAANTDTGAATTTTTGAMAPATTTDPSASATAPAADATAPATNNNMAATPETDNTQTAAIDRTTLTEVPADQLTSENLVGTNVYGANDADVGDISDIALTADGKVDAVLLDVGGFLGMGEKTVAIGMDKLQFMQDGNGNRYLYTTFTKEQLEAQAAYDKDTYAEQRDQQRLTVQ